MGLVECLSVRSSSKGSSDAIVWRYHPFHGDRLRCADFHAGFGERGNLLSSKPFGYWSRRRVALWAGAFLLMFGALIYMVLMRLRTPWDRATILPEDIRGATVPPRLDGTHPCVFAVASADGTAGSLGRCATPTERADVLDRFEVDLRYGAFVIRQSDLLLDDDSRIPLTRSYISRDWAGMTRMHAFGRNSNHSFDIAPVGNKSPYTYLMLALEDGDVLYYKRISKGDGFENAVYLHTETSTSFYLSTIAWNGKGWTLKLKNGLEMHFPEASKALSLAQCAASEIVDPSGDTLTLKRDKNRNLEEVRSLSGHRFHFSYDDAGRILEAENDGGRSVRYRYNDGGMLKDAMSSSGRKRHYEYDGVLMTAIVDESGRTLIRNGYKDGLLVEQHYTNGEVYRFSYVWDPQKAFLNRVVITFPNGRREELSLADSVPEVVLSF
jgi:YD repeat-containing protein